jgi:uncharacterized delta-60 repeat protein
MSTILLFFKNNRHLLLAIVTVFVLLTVTQVLAASVTLDPTFGTNGIVTADLGSSSDSSSDIALQSDGKIVMLGAAQGQRPVLMRYNSNGSVDNTFGTNGKLNLDFGRRLAVQQDGKLLIAGSSEGSFAVARYNSNGTSLDNAFGTNGVAIIPSASGDIFDYSASDLAVESNGRIVVAGTCSNRYGHSVFSAIARLNSDGTPYDTDYGSVIWLDGVFSYANYNFGEAVAAQPDGKIVVFGNTMDDESYNMRPFLVRLNLNSSLDKTFGTNGRGAVIIPVPRFHYDKGSMVIQADGRIVVAGTVGNIDDVHNDLVVARFNANGTLDSTFSGTGIVVADFGTNEFGTDVHLQADGKLVVVGTSSTGDSSNLLIVRYNKDGSLDAAFGDNGKLISNLGNSSASGAGIEVRPNGKFIVAGSSNGDAFLARYDVSDATGRLFNDDYESLKPFDGTILELGENSNTGRAVDRNAVTFNVGDDQKNRQYRGILSFNTSSLPDNALVISARLEIKKQAVRGTDPMLTFGDLLLDMRNGTFGDNLALQAGDFAAPASLGSLPDRFSSFTESWYTADLSDTNLAFINKIGMTQFRVRFSLDDNDDREADYIKFFSGNSTEDNRPQLIITYTLDAGSVSSMMPYSLPAMVEINQLPTITSNGELASAHFSIQENVSAVTIVTGTDLDLQTQTLTYSITGGVDSSRFNLDPSTGALAFVSAPDFEIPMDASLDNVYNVTVQASDGMLAATQDIAVTVTAVNDNAPVLTSNSSLSIVENTTTVTTVTATDADLPAQTLTYSIGGTDSSLFNINSSTGELIFITAPDFDVPTDASLDNIYNVTVQASDGVLAATQDIAVIVTAANDNTPVITSDSGFNIPENTSSVTTITTTDADLPVQTLTYSISGGPDAAHFNIDPSTGVLAFVTPPDFEAPSDAGMDNIYNVTIQASDGSLAVTQDLAITVMPVNDNTPVITSANTLNVPENIPAVAAITASDTDLPAEILTYSIKGGPDSLLFNIDSSTGKLNFITPPDFETLTDAGLDNIYNVTVQASDGTLSAAQDMVIIVTAVNDNTPIITSIDKFTIPENTSSVMTVTATDADLPAQILTYSIAGGSDVARFSIDPSTGILAFIAPSDFESPADTGLDNTYNVMVQASDGTLSTTKDLTVTVTSVNDNIPVVTSPSGFSTPENILIVTTVTASDADLPTQALSFAIIDGLDSVRFSINPTTGVLAFIAPPDFESPNDAGLDNIYNFRVQVSDGVLVIAQDFIFTVTDVAD